MAEEIYVQTATSAETAYQKADELRLRGFSVQTFDSASLITIDSLELDGGGFGRGVNHYLLIGSK